MSGMTINLIIQLFVGAIGDNVVGATFARFLRADHVTYPMLPRGRLSRFDANKMDLVEYLKGI